MCKYLTIPYLLVLLLSIGIVHAEPTNQQWSTLINLSGKQRMLTQKMTKEVLEVAMDLKASSLDDLKSTMELFDKTLDGLQNGDANLGLVKVENGRINRQLKKVAQLWRPFKKKVEQVIKDKMNSSPVNKSNIVYLRANNLLLLKEMNRAVRLYEKYSSKASRTLQRGKATTINLAGKQRMLTQKMTKELLFIKYEANVDKELKNTLLNTIQLFDKTLAGLRFGDPLLGLPGTAIPEANYQLTVVEEIWQDLKKDFMDEMQHHKLSGGSLQHILDKNMMLLQEMDKAVTIFANTLN